MYGLAKSGMETAWRGTGSVWRTSAGKHTMIGAGLGAAWGAADRDTSVLGGAFKGALAGGGVYSGRRAIRTGLARAKHIGEDAVGPFKPGALAGMRMGGGARAAAWDLRQQGKAASRFFGSAFEKGNRAVVDFAAYAGL